jgi:hypothetical protein
MMAATQSQAQTGQAGVEDAWLRVSAHGENGGGVRDAPRIDPAVSFDSACSDISVNTHIQWACVARDETLLVVVGDELLNEVLSTARNLLNKKATVGWDSYQQSWRGGLKGLKFHVYQEGSGEELIVWTFACVYDSARNSRRQAQSFLEKIVVISEMWREADDSWKKGRHLACQHLFGPVLQQRMQEFSYLGDIAVADNGLNISRDVVTTNRNLINRKKRGEARDNAEDEAVAQEEALLRKMEAFNMEVALLRKMEAFNMEVLSQDMHEQEIQEERRLLKQMEAMNKEVLSATEMAKAKQEQATEKADESDKLRHLGHAYDNPSGTASVFKDCIASTEHADAPTFDESESEDEDGHLEDGAITAVLRFLDDELDSTGKGSTEESVTSKTSAESSSSNQGEEKVKEFEVLLDEMGQNLDWTKSLRETTTANPFDDILLKYLGCHVQEEVLPTGVQGIESILRDLEGDVWGEREARMGSEVRVDSFHEDASALTDIPVEQKDSNCFQLAFWN